MTSWDQRFAIDGYKYGTEPNAFLVEQACHFPAQARLLVPGDGEGRNGVWLAEQGHQVTSVDSSSVGLRKALALAKEREVKLNTLLADLGEWAPTPASVDGVALIFVHLPTAIRRTAHRRLAQGLLPGRVLILEAFHPRQLGYSSGGPQDESMLYRLDLLRDDFAGLLTEVVAWEGEVCIAEGEGHQGPAYVTRWVGRS